MLPIMYLIMVTLPPLPSPLRRHKLRNLPRMVLPPTFPCRPVTQRHRPRVTQLTFISRFRPAYPAPSPRPPLRTSLHIPNERRLVQVKRVAQPRPSRLIHHRHHSVRRHQLRLVHLFRVVRQPRHRHRSRPDSHPRRRERCVQRARAPVWRHHMPRRAPIEREQRRVQVGAPVAEDAPGLARRSDLIEVVRVDKGCFLVATGVGHDRTRLIGHERRAIEGDGNVGCDRDFLPNAVGRDDRDHVRGSMPLHAALPLRASVHGRVLRLGADSGGVHEEFCALQGHTASGLGEPLVPAYAEANCGEASLEDTEACVARGEVVLLLVTRAIRDVGLAVDTKLGTVGVNDDDGVEVGVVCALIKADGQDDVEFTGEGLEAKNVGFIILHGNSEAHAIHLVNREVEGSEEFLKENDICTLTSGISDERFCSTAVLVYIGRRGKLDSCDGDNSLR